MHIRIAPLFFAVLFSSAAAAEFYIGGSVGTSRFDDTVDDPGNFRFFGSELPSEISLNGLLLDQSETALGAFVGWRTNDWLSLELGYSDLGEAAQRSLGVIGIGIPFRVPLNSPPDPGFFTRIPPTVAGPAAMGIEEWSVTAKFSKPLVSKLSANWLIGISLAEFDAVGELTLREIVSFDPLEFRNVTIPFASPDSDEGIVYGFGFAWEFSDRFSADLGYRKHDTPVFDVETLSARFIVGL